jgi:hypothetical protein
MESEGFIELDIVHRPGLKVAGFLAADFLESRAFRPARHIV